MALRAFLTIPMCFPLCFLALGTFAHIHREEQQCTAEGSCSFDQGLPLQLELSAGAAVLLQKDMRTDAALHLSQTMLDSSSGNGEVEISATGAVQRYSSNSLEEIAKATLETREQEEEAAKAAAAAAAEAASSSEEASNKAEAADAAAKVAAELLAEAAAKAAEEAADETTEVRDLAAASAVIRSQESLLPDMPVWTVGNGSNISMMPESIVGQHYNSSELSLLAAGSASGSSKKLQQRWISWPDVTESYNAISNVVESAVEQTVTAIDNAVEAVSDTALAWFDEFMECLDVNMTELVCEVFLDDVCSCDAGSYLTMTGLHDVELYCKTRGVELGYSTSWDPADDNETDSSSAPTPAPTQDAHRRRRMPGGSTPAVSPPNNQRTRPTGQSSRARPADPGACTGTMDLTLDATLEFTPEFKLKGNFDTQEFDIDIEGEATFYAGAFAYAEGSCSYNVGTTLPKKPWKKTICPRGMCITIMVAGDLELDLQGQINGSAYVYFEKSVTVSATAHLKVGDDQPQITVHEPTTSDSKGIELAIQGSATATVKLGPHVAIIPTPGFPVNVHPWVEFELGVYGEASYAQNWTHTSETHQNEEDDPSHLGDCSEAIYEETPATFNIIAGARWEFHEGLDCRGDDLLPTFFVPGWKVGNNDYSAAMMRQSCAQLCLTTPGCKSFGYPRVADWYCTLKTSEYSTVKGSFCPSAEFDQWWSFYTLLDQNCVGEQSFCHETGAAKAKFPVIAGSIWEKTSGHHYWSQQQYDSVFGWQGHTEGWLSGNTAQAVVDRLRCAENCLAHPECKTFTYNQNNDGSNCQLWGPDCVQSTLLGSTCGWPDNNNDMYSLIGDHTCPIGIQHCKEAVGKEDFPVISGAEWEFQPGLYCDAITECLLDTVEWDGGSQAFYDRRRCARKCLETAGCVAFNFVEADPSWSEHVGVNHGACCMMGDGGQHSTRLGKTCGVPDPTIGHYTLVTRDCNGDGVAVAGLLEAGATAPAFNASSGATARLDDRAASQAVLAAASSSSPSAAAVASASAAEKQLAARRAETIARMQSSTERQAQLAALATAETARQEMLSSGSLQRYSSAAQSTLAKQYFAWRIEREEAQARRAANETLLLQQAQSKERRVVAQRALKEKLGRAQRSQFASSVPSQRKSVALDGARSNSSGIEACWASALNVRFGFDFAIFFPEWIIEKVSDIIGVLTDDICGAIALVKSKVDYQVALFDHKIVQCLPSTLGDVTEHIGGVLDMIKGIVDFADGFCEMLDGVLPTIEDLLNGVNFRNELSCTTIAQTADAHTCGSLLC